MAADPADGDDTEQLGGAAGDGRRRIRTLEPRAERAAARGAARDQAVRQGPGTQHHTLHTINNFIFY